MRRPRPTTLARWCLTCLTAALVTAWSLAGSWELRWAGFAGSTYYTGQSARGLLEFTLTRTLGNVGWTLGWDLRRRPPTPTAVDIAQARTIRREHTQLVGPMVNHLLSKPPQRRGR